MRRTLWVIVDVMRKNRSFYGSKHSRLVFSSFNFRGLTRVFTPALPFLSSSQYQVQYSDQMPLNSSNWLDRFVKSQLVTRGSFSIRLFSYQLRLDKHVHSFILSYLSSSKEMEIDIDSASFIYSDNVILKVSLQLYPYSNWIKGQTVSLSLFVSCWIEINSSGLD